MSYTIGVFPIWQLAENSKLLCVSVGIHAQFRHFRICRETCLYSTLAYNNSKNYHMQIEIRSRGFGFLLWGIFEIFFCLRYWLMFFINQFFFQKSFFWEQRTLRLIFCSFCDPICFIGQIDVGAPQGVYFSCLCASAGDNYSSSDLA